MALDRGEVKRNRVVDSVVVWTEALDRWNLLRTREAAEEYENLDTEIEQEFGMSGAGLVLVAVGLRDSYINRQGRVIRVVD